MDTVKVTKELASSSGTPVVPKSTVEYLDKTVTTFKHKPNAIDTIVEQSSMTHTEHNTASLRVRKISNKKKMTQSSIDFANLSKKSNGFDMLKMKMSHSSTKNDLKNLTTPCLGKPHLKPFVAGGAIQPKVL